MAAGAAVKITEEYAREFLRRRVIKPGSVVVAEMRPSVGFKHEERRIDLWAIECSPAKGMPATAYEIKTSRSDWTRELRQPMKRRMAYAVSNYYWLVAPKGVIGVEELPQDAGLLEIDVEKAETLRWYTGDHIKLPNYRDKVRCNWGLFASVLRARGAEPLEEFSEAVQ